MQCLSKETQKEHCILGLDSLSFQIEREVLGWTSCCCCTICAIHPSFGFEKLCQQSIYPLKRFAVGKKQYVSSFNALHDANILLRDWHIPFVHHVDKQNNSYAGIEQKYKSINVSARAPAGLRLAHLQPLLDLLLKTSGYPRFPRPLFTLLADNSLTMREPHSATTWRRLQTLRGSMDLRASQSINLALYQCRHKLIIRIVE